MPAEWEPRAASWLAWPTSLDDWADCLDAAEAEFVGLVRALAARERTELLTSDLLHVRSRLAHVSAEPSLRLHEIPTAEPYLRDTGPGFVHDASGELRAIDWRFDAWGGKYPGSRVDDAVAARIAALACVPHVRCDLVVEGGALEPDGEGTLLATRSSLLDPKRNPGLTEALLAERLHELLGIEHIVWIEGSVAGDDTDGHVDNLARFTAPGRVVCLPGVEGLAGARDARGRTLERIELPPPPDLRADGRPLPASYANFYLATGAVLVPQFGVDTDTDALETLRALLPEREPVALPVRTLLRGGGGLHCLTQPQPQPQPRVS
jgi:agmatine deiminase